MAGSEISLMEPRVLFELDRCVHCGLCLTACPTYRVLGLEMDSPRGRIYQMVKVAEGELPLSPTFVKHIDQCVACRGCESACPSGVHYGELLEHARALIEQRYPRPVLQRLLRSFLFRRIIPSPTGLKVLAFLLWLYQKSGIQLLVRRARLLPGKLRAIEPFTPQIEWPSFFRNYGRLFPAEGRTRYRVAFFGGCIANVAFARLNEATVRVLRKNGCEVWIPTRQTCCGALHAHAGRIEEARQLARRNIEAFLQNDCDAIVSNAAGCGAALKEYGAWLREDPAYSQRAREFASKVRDVTEFLDWAGLSQPPGRLPVTVTYQDSCHLVHAQKIRAAPRRLLRAVPGLELREMPFSDVCCGSGGIYNVVQHELSRQILQQKMQAVNRAGADWIVTANPGCLIQLRAGVQLYGRGQRVLHVIEVLDEAYQSRA